jgi:AcrR family transcriptional regulator
VILDAAEERLRHGGPDAIRLQDIARDVGISHPTILHHFESRDGLTQSLAARAMDRLEHELIALLETAPAVEETAQSLVERIFATLGDAGHARLLAWRALQAGSPAPLDRQDSVLSRFTKLVHDRRRRLGGDQAAASREDSEFIVRLTAAAMLGVGLFGPFLDHWTGHDPDPALRRRFRTWFARLLIDRTARGAEARDTAARAPRTAKRRR